MKKELSRKLLLVVLVITLSVKVNASIRPVLSVAGNTVVSVNDIETYNAILGLGLVVYDASWYVVGGVIQSQTLTSVTVKWTVAGAGSVNYDAFATNQGPLEANLFIAIKLSSTPAPPPDPTIVNQTCTSAELQKTGTIPSGEEWYWQTSSTGTSTSNNATSNYPVTSSGTYYIRSYNSSTSTWSSSSGSVTVTLGTVGGSTWYADTDGDGLGDSNTTTVQCTQPSGYVSVGGDLCPSEAGSSSNNGCPLMGDLSNENYIYNITPQIPVTDINNLIENKDALKNVTYYDGLGRPMQSNAIMQSGVSQQDIVTHIAYDNIGRQDKEYLPYVPSSDNKGLYISTGVESATNSFYQNLYPDDMDVNNPNPYSQKEFESSPLNRVFKQAAPGKDWALGQGHEIEFDYETNIDGEVRLYSVTTTSVDNTYTPTLVLSNSYEAGELYKNMTYDENHSGEIKDHSTEEFKDKQGKVVLKRTYNNEVRHDTYYVYDNFGNLAYVLPPKSEANITMPTSTILYELCYQYIYDHRNRLVEKKIPGKGWEYVVYDILDRPILTQDQVQRDKTTKEWLFTKYDVFGRVAYTGLYKDSRPRKDVQTSATNHAIRYESSGTDIHKYTNNAYPISINVDDIYTVNYYDTYQDLPIGLESTVTSYEVNSTTRTKGLPTVTKTRVLETNDWVTTINYYDDKGRPIYIHTQNDYLETTDIVKSKLDFAGKVEQTASLHTNLNDDINSTITVIDSLFYDHAGRLTKQTQTIDENTEIIAENTYDELGQLESKGVGGKTTQSRLQTVNYTYNIRGWLKNINQDVYSDNDLFNFTLMYNDIADTSKKLFNGNISQTSWNTLSDNTTGNPISTQYTYTYDALNRITAAIDNTSNYNLTNVAYDKNGNITNLERKGHINTGATSFGVMDNLVYNYETNSNKLKKVLDNGNDTFGFKDVVNLTTEYVYDANGNLVKDLNKGIGTSSVNGITYNHLNLPTEIKFDNSSTKKINYTYSADGIKLKKVVSDGGSLTTTDYANGYVYENNTLQFFNHAEGYVNNDNGTFKYVYNYLDHLDSIRLSYSDGDGNGSISQSEIIKENHYYPFGLQHKGYNNVVNGTENNWDYQGKENQKELGLNWHDFGARNYDAALGSWMNPDPLADLRYELTPYNYVQNSPMFKIDPDGLTDYTLNKKTGEVTQVGEANDEPDRILKTYTRKSKRGEVKYKKNGEAKVAIGGIEQGILSDGQNLRTDDSVIEVGGEGQATVDGVKSFTLQLSEYVGKEIKGFSYSSDGSGDVSDMVLGKYIKNDRTTSYGTPLELQKKYRGNFSFNNMVQQFHTHPDGKLGATQSAPGQSQDVTNLQNDKPKISNATFIILYRINGQKKPEEYDYTHQYRPKK